MDLNQKRFDSCPLLHERNLFCLPRQERFFHAFRGKIALNIGKYRWNRGWNGRSDCTSPCFLLFGGQTGAILFAFLCSAKKLAKQHLAGFEYGKVWRCRKSERKRLCKSAGFLLRNLVIEYISSKEYPWRWHMAQEDWQNYKLPKLLGHLGQRQHSGST